MRVLYISPSYTVHDRRFLEGIIELGDQAVFLPEASDGWPEQRPLPAGIERAGWNGNPLPELARRLGCDLVHAGPLSSCAARAARAGCRPLVAVSWGFDLLEQARSDPKARLAVEQAIGAAQGVLVDCRTLEKEVRALVPDWQGVVECLPWGVDLGAFRPRGARSAVRERLGWDSMVVVMATRNWEPLYRVDWVVEAFARASAREARLRLILAGSGSQRDQIRRLVEERCRAGSVDLAGALDPTAMGAWLEAADLYLSACPVDGTSVSLLEAMATGLAPVVADTPSNREWVEEGRTGWLAGSIEGLAGCLMEAAAAGPETRGRMGRSARLEVERRADWRRNLPRLGELYRRAAQAATRVSTFSQAGNGLGGAAPLGRSRGRPLGPGRLLAKGTVS